MNVFSGWLNMWDRAVGGGALFTAAAAAAAAAAAGGGATACTTLPLLACLYLPDEFGLQVVLSNTPVTTAGRAVDVIDCLLSWQQLLLVVLLLLLLVMLLLPVLLPWPSSP